MEATRGQKNEILQTGLNWIYFQKARGVWL